MFGPVRGPWPDESWKGWWGEEPPYHVPTFVHIHNPPKSVEKKGGTTFHFVTDGIRAALQRAKDAAKDKDVGIGGGVATIQQYLRARLIALHCAFIRVNETTKVCRTDLSIQAWATLKEEDPSLDETELVAC